MNDGGDWSRDDQESPERPKNDPVSHKAPAPQKPNAAPTPTPGTQAGTAVTLTALLMFGALVASGFVVAMTTRSVETSELAQRAELEAQEAARRAQQAHSDERHAHAMALEESKRLLTELLTFWQDFDTQARDKTAARLVELHRQGVSRRGIEEHLMRTAAWDALLTIDTPESRHWFDVATRTQAWDTIATLNPNSVATPQGARAFCLAGEVPQADGVYGWLYKHPDLHNFRPSAMACGMTPDQQSGLVSASPRADELGVISARDALKAVRIKAFKNVHRHSRGSFENVSLGAALYVDGAIDAPAFLGTLNRLSTLCDAVTPDLQYANEVALPHVFVDALSSLKESKTNLDAYVLDVLSAAALQSALLHGVEPPKIEHKGPAVERCLALLEYESDPAAAQKRLQSAVNASEHDESSLELLALAAARAGDFETALRSAQRLVAITSPKEAVRRRAEWLVLAFAHKTGQLDAVDLLGADESVVAVRDALAGDDEARSAQRAEFTYYPTALVAAYVRGALAPGHEEAFADGHIERWPLSPYLFARAEAARWRGDTDAEALWLARRAAVHKRAGNNQHGGIQLLWTDN